MLTLFVVSTGFEQHKDSTNETPFETNARLKKEKQKAAENSLKNDPTVKSLMDTFDASIDQDSIQPQ